MTDDIEALAKQLDKGTDPCCQCGVCEILRREAAATLRQLEQERDEAINELGRRMDSAAGHYGSVIGTLSEHVTELEGALRDMLAMTESDRWGTDFPLSEVVACDQCGGTGTDPKYRGTYTPYGVCEACGGCGSLPSPKSEVNNGKV